MAKRTTRTHCLGGGQCPSRQDSLRSEEVQAVGEGGIGCVYTGGMDAEETTAGGRGPRASRQAHDAAARERHKVSQSEGAFHYLRCA